MKSGSNRAGRADEAIVYRFILDQIDSVPHLEALLQLWNVRPKEWSEVEMAARLFVQPAQARSIMRDLIRRKLALERTGTGLYSYLSSPEMDSMMEAVAELYRTDLIRVSTAIHSKASSGALEFARAFKITRKRQPK